MGFFNGHNHTHYSNLRIVDCIIKPKDLIDRAIQLGLSGVAITDHECLSAHMEVNLYAQKIHEQYPDFTIALGNEIYLTETREKGQPYYHFILIAKDALGHKALRELSSTAWYNSYFDRGMERVPTLKSELSSIVNKYKGHLIATTACIGGELPKLLLARNSLKMANLNTNEVDEKINNFITFCINTFGQDNFFIECAPSTANDQILANRLLAAISKEYNIKLVVATDSHYLSKETRFAHKAYLNSKDGEREVDTFYEFARLMDEEEVKELLHHSFPYEEKIGEEKDFVDIILENTEYVRQQITYYSLAQNQHIPTVNLPEYPAYVQVGLEKYPTLNKLFTSTDNQERYWINECWKALIEKNLINNEEYIARLETEADVIDFIGHKLGTCLFAYFNTFKHYIDLFWECGSIVGPGRGSATGFLSNYLLGITQLDPIRWKLPWFRFLNKERAELPDIDIDLAPSKRPAIFNAIRQERGELGLIQVVTFGTEGTKSAIQTACRGYRHQDENGIELYPNGIDVDIALYISSLIPQQRGFLWSIHDVVYGNEELGRAPVKEFIKEVNQYDGLLSIIENIEGIIKQRGIHASGVMLYDVNHIYDTAAIMKAPSGDLVTAYDLHMAEAAGDTKYDFLVTEVSDKIIEALKLMEADSIIPTDSLRNIYNKYLHPEIIDTNTPDIWQALASGSVLDVFQFGTGVGLAMAKKLQPKNPIEMTAANAMIRLMSEPGVESQQDRYYRIKNGGIKIFDDEMRQHQLPENMIKALHKYCDEYYGCVPIQEQMMMILMDENISSFTLAEANDARKIVAKKQMKRIPELREHFYKTMKKEYADYVWELAIAPQLGYAFSLNHSLPYSFVGIQTLILGTRFNPVYWNTACLIVNSGATDSEMDGTTNYGKIAKAIGDITSRGIIIKPVDINISEYGFKPKADSGEIFFGLKGLLNVGDDVIDMICKNRPYVNFADFLLKVPANKQAIISLIKSGAFDTFDERKKIMAQYIWKTCDKKVRLNLQNMSTLLKRNLIPDTLKKERSVFEFNRYLKDICGKTDALEFCLDERAMRFLETNFCDAPINMHDNCYWLNKKAWDKVYQKVMDKVRDYIKDNQQEMLYQLNKMIFFDDWQKYAKGTYSAWEMEVMCYYYHDHELKNVNKLRYGLSDFNKLPEEPIVDTVIHRKGVTIPIYKLTHICGTVIAKNKTKGDISLLTTDGVVHVWFRKEYFALFDKQISARGEDGSKHVIEKSWFNRGNMLIITGMRRGDDFIPKKYASTQGHQLYRITEIKADGSLTLQYERAKGEQEDDEN